LEDTYVLPLPLPLRGRPNKADPRRCPVDVDVVVCSVSSVSLTLSGRTGTAGVDENLSSWLPWRLKSKRLNRLFRFRCRSLVRLSLFVLRLLLSTFLPRFHASHNKLVWQLRYCLRKQEKAKDKDRKRDV
jgi:hypothetical protein